MTIGNTQVTFMQTSEGNRIPLVSTVVNASLHDLLADVTMTQIYKNSEDKNIESVYTFPLPLDAVLLDVDITLNERKLKGCIVEKREAEKRYEEAIVDGNTAIMLEKLEAGLYTMDIGNLQSGEIVEISIRYSVLHRWQGDQLRFYLPTAVAPRFGVPDIEPHQIPCVDLFAKNTFSFRFRVTGLLKTAAFESPGHDIVCDIHDDHTLIHLNSETAFMDRDLIINIRNKAKSAASAVYDRDGDGFVSLVSFKPVFEQKKVDAPHAITIVVDCSGSMTGDSINQAKEALQRILAALRPCDFFNIILFGSTYKSLFRAMTPVNPLATGKAKLFVNKIDADMGGTEIGDALSAAYRLQRKTELPQDILLITDGEVWSTEEIICDAKKSAQRIFSVGVGSSVSESFIQELARTTGGACELVSPKEDMAERIYRHARRMYGKRSKDVIVTWPSESSTQTPKQINSVFDGDTVHLFSYSQSRPVGNASIQVVLQNDESWNCILPLLQMPDSNGDELSVLCRIAADSRLRDLDSEQAGKIAFKYQLMSKWTNFLVVDDRPVDNQAKDLPELRQVPHMLAAGWGGVGDVTSLSESSASYAPNEISSVGYPMAGSNSDKLPVSFAKIEFNDDEFAVPTFLRRSSSDISTGTPKDILFNIDRNMKQMPKLHQLTLDDLFDLGVPENVIDLLQEMVDDGFDENLVVLCFLDILVTQVGGVLRFAKRNVASAFKGLTVDPLLKGKMKSSFSNLNKSRWTM